jgi:hypothetical protein
MRLICIDDDSKELTWGKEYEINSSYYSVSYWDRSMAPPLSNMKIYYSLFNDKGEFNDYLSDRFVTLKEFRERQLNKLIP